jgi:hypothetical protein
MDGFGGEGIFSCVREEAIQGVYSKRRHPDLNRGIKVLQTSALPLGYAAASYLNCYSSRKWCNGLPRAIDMEPRNPNIYRPSGNRYSRWGSAISSRNAGRFAASFGIAEFALAGFSLALNSSDRAAQAQPITPAISEVALQGLAPGANVILEATNDITINDLADFRGNGGAIAFCCGKYYGRSYKFYWLQAKMEGRSRTQLNFPFDKKHKV